MKRGFAALLACILMVLSAPALAGGDARLTLYLGSSMVLTDENGVSLTDPAAYLAIFEVTDPTLPLSERRFAAQRAEDEKYGLIDANGAPVSEFVYDELYRQGDGVRCCRDGLYGVLNASGEVTVDVAYTLLISNGAGGYVALRDDPYDDKPDGVYLLGADGAETATGVMVTTIAADYAEGLLPAASAENGLFGYLGPDGTWKIQPQYDYADTFAYGCASAAISTGTGVISPDGTWLVTPKYAYVEMPVSEDSKLVIAVTAQGDVTFIRRADWQATRTYASATAYASVSDGTEYIVVYEGDACSLLDAEGETLFTLPGDYSIYLWDLKGGQVVVCEGAWGEACCRRYTLSGEPTGEAYQWLYYLGECGGEPMYGFATFETEAYENGETTLYTEVPGTMRVGVVNQNDEVVVPAEYSTLYLAADDRLWLEKDGTGYLVDLNGNTLAQYPLGDSNP